MLFRCRNCDDVLSFIFEADKPVCPKCGATQVNGIVIPQMRIHFIVAAPEGAIQGGDGVRYDAACMVGKKHNSMSEQITATPVAVNCPKCRATPIFLEHANADPVIGLQSQLLKGPGCC